jgi:hypothetical protein
MVSSRPRRGTPSAFVRARPLLLGEGSSSGVASAGGDRRRSRASRRRQRSPTPQEVQEEEHVVATATTTTTDMSSEDEGVRQANKGGKAPRDEGRQGARGRGRPGPGCLPTRSCEAPYHSACSQPPSDSAYGEEVSNYRCYHNYFI